MPPIERHEKKNMVVVIGLRSAPISFLLSSTENGAGSTEHRSVQSKVNWHRVHREGAHHNRTHEHTREHQNQHLAQHRAEHIKVSVEKLCEDGRRQRGSGTITEEMPRSVAFAEITLKG